MARTVSTSEAKARLSGLMDWLGESQDEVVIESHGRPRAVLIGYSEYRQFLEWHERQRREAALAELQQLARTIQAKNQDLSVETGQALADRFARELIEEMIAEGKVDYRPDLDRSVE